MKAPGHVGRRLALVLLLVSALLMGLVAWLNVRGESSIEATEADPGNAGLIERGAYLARAGNCIGCHTVAGGASFAGGRGVETPFGVVMAPNITPDAKTGIGEWTTADFWRAMHHGRSKDGRLLYPAFPYPSFTYVTRQDSDAIFAYLMSMPAVVRANEPHRLGFPYNTQAALAVWRALYFRPGALLPEAGRSADWARGRYLVQGLGHCAACHSGRNALGGTGLNAEFAGGLMPDATWYAPSLASPHEAGLQHWPAGDVASLLKTGWHPARRSRARWPRWSSRARNTCRRRTSLPWRTTWPAFPSGRLRRSSLGRPTATRWRTAPRCTGFTARRAMARREKAFRACTRPWRATAVLLPTANNVVQMIRRGGFAPTTAGHPRPFGMPPYGQLLDDREIAAVATFIRQSWGHAAPPVSPLDVLRVK